jgi:hypothetical protein
MLFKKKQMQHYPTIWQLLGLTRHAANGPSKEINGIWFPCRPLGPSHLKNRLKAVWLVWTGKADVVVWPGDQ